MGFMIETIIQESTEDILGIINHSELNGILTQDNIYALSYLDSQSIDYETARLDTIDRVKKLVLSQNPKTSQRAQALYEKLTKSTDETSN